MSLIKFTKNITCVDGLICNKKCMDKFENLFKFNLDGHVSISHQNKNHIFWIFFYEKNGEHLSESKGKIIKTKEKNIKKFTKTIPSLKEIEKSLSD